MSVIESLVFDRTQDDVDALEAFLLAVQAGTAEIGGLDLTTAKGAYNVSDLNRVTQALEHLHGRLTEYGCISGYMPVEISHRDGTADTVWREDDEDITAPKFEAYLANVRAMRAALPTLPTTPLCPEDMAELTVSDANAMERILADLETVINAMRAALLRSGQVLLHSGGPAVYMLEEEKSFIVVYTADEKYLATTDWRAVAVKEDLYA